MQLTNSFSVWYTASAPYPKQHQSRHNLNLTDSFSVWYTASAPYTKQSESLEPQPSTQPARDSAAHTASASPGA